MDPANPNPTQDPLDDLQLKSPQDALDTDESTVDDVTHSLTDDPTEELGVDPKAFKEELDKYDFDEAGHGDDDMREEIESRDMENAEDVDSRR
ncbi:MAG: hypothetical protein JWO54_809 [Candidatus Saccharibacteria bacterium]|nr:hypothetical protein [Candidatus Saccharibacteria bacterium]MDB5181046.1 hypothetical protein [Candidatus Saccharibacteria bacterium]